MTTAQAAIRLRPPHTQRQPSSEPADFKLPTPAWLSGTWHVTHSTLPMWKTRRNVRITYTVLDTPSATDDENTPASSASGPKVDDLVEYQSLTSTKVQTIHGVDTPKGDGAYGWRGKGWLAIATSKWEVIGWGGDGGSDEGEQWALTYFTKTMFTPAGLDIYARSKEGLSEGLMQRIREGMKTLDAQGADGELAKLMDTMFEVKRDDSRKD